MKNRSYVLIALQFDIRSIQAQLHQWDGSDKQLYTDVFRDLVAARVPYGALRRKNTRGLLSNEPRGKTVVSSRFTAPEAQPRERRAGREWSTVGGPQAQKGAGDVDRMTSAAYDQIVYGICGALWYDTSTDKLV